MSKKPLKYFSFKLYILLFTVYCLLFTVFGCTPRVVPPPLYRDIDLTLEEIIERAKGDINTIKAVAGINIEKDNKPYFYLDASLLLKEPNWLQMRWYKLGILTGSLLIKDNVVYTSSGKGADRFKKLGDKLYYSVFWWEDIENASLYKQGSEYVIRTKNRKIHIDKSTLIPQTQEITVNSNKIYIGYDRPVQTFTGTQPGNDFWYPSEVRIETGSYSFSVKIVKLIINPPLNENDFKTPGIE